MKRWIYLGSLLILTATLQAQSAGSAVSEIRNVEVVPAENEIRVEITLSTAVTPAVEIAQHPDRLILRMPGTASQARQQRLAVQRLGVRAVRFGLNRSEPPESRLVVDLDEEHSYKILTDGTKITLILEAPLSYSARRRTPPAAAASRPLISSIGGRANTDSGQPGTQTDHNGQLLTPPPSGPPITFPPASSTQDTQSRAASNPPSAKHPNTASLAQGTVFPSAGSPGAGIVPPVSEIPRPSGLDSNAPQVSASAQAQPGTANNTVPQEPKQTASALPEATTPVRQDSVASLPKSSGQTVAEALPAAPTPEPKQPSQNSASVQAALPPDSSAGVPPVVAEASRPGLSEPATTPALPEPSAVEPAAQAAQTSKPTESEIQQQPPPPAVAEAAPEPAVEGSGQGQLLTQASVASDLHTAFRVKYVAQDAAYLDGGRAAGLVEGMKLIVRDLRESGAVAADGADVAELEVLSVAETSSVTEIHLPKRPVKVGDLAYLSSADQQALVERNALSATRKYPAVVSFTENDTLDEEARMEVPKPPLPSVNRARGRIGFDYIGTMNHDGSGMHSSNLGIVLRADITRINGTYWNVSGYWRGRLNSSGGGNQQTLQDLINRTYHLYTTYDNPTSAWVAGFGRMYLPWATSLDTIDGGYFGRKLGHGATAGVFLGSTPDPTSYSYDPKREIGGGFVNFQGGSYDDLYYTSTFGGGIKMNKWSVDRPFAFMENGIYFKRVFSIYQSAQLAAAPGYYYPTTDPPGTAFQPGTGFGVARNFLTLRIQPHSRIEFSANHTYFRDMPTFDPNLIGTGLLDKYLFQGFSGGTRIEVYKHVWVSADLGLSNRTGDKNNSLNQMFGITFGRLPWIGLRADARYSRFSSSFGDGSYQALSFSKNLGETLQLHVMLGQQNFASTLTTANKSRFVNGTIETTLGPNYFLQAGGTINRGSQMNYDQWMFTFGYRFDNRHGHRGQ